MDALCVQRLASTLGLQLEGLVLAPPCMPWPHQIWTIQTVSHLHAYHASDCVPFGTHVSTLFPGLWNTVRHRYMDAVSGVMMRLTTDMIQLLQAYCTNCNILSHSLEKACV